MMNKGDGCAFLVGLLLSAYSGVARAQEPISAPPISVGVAVPIVTATPPQLSPAPRKNWNLDPHEEMYFNASISRIIHTQKLIVPIMQMAGLVELTDGYAAKVRSCYQPLAAPWQNLTWKQPSARSNALNMYLENAGVQFIQCSAKPDWNVLSNANHFLNQAIGEIDKIAPGMCSARPLALVPVPPEVMQPLDAIEYWDIVLMHLAKTEYNWELVDTKLGTREPPA